MPVRIYSLAKELKVDSKELVELCSKAGITGKGSALASLTDEEAQRMTEFVRSRSAGAAAPAPTHPAASVAPVREAVRSAPIRELPPAGSPRRQIRAPQTTASAADGEAARREATQREAVAEAAPATPPPVPQKPLAERASFGTSSPTKDQPTKDQPAADSPSPAATAPLAKAPLANSPGGGAASNKPPAPAARSGDAASRSPLGRGGSGFSLRTKAPESLEPIRRDAVLPSTPKIRVLGSRPRRDGDSGGGQGGGNRAGGKRREPVVNLAALPEAPAMPTRPAKDEAPAQKPDIKLSKDVIAGHKQGVRAPLEKLAKAEDEKKRIGSGGLSGFSSDKGKRAGAGAGSFDDDGPRRRPGLAGMASARADRAKGGRRTGRRGDSDPGFGRDDMRRRRTIRRKGTNTAAPRKDRVQLELPCTVRSFSEAAGVPVAQVLRVLMGMQMMANINAQLDLETAELLAVELELELDLRDPGSLEDQLITQIEEDEDEDADLAPRPPIVTFLGHVDHGKTSLLDRLIGRSVAKGEAGGITQHIRAYQVDHDGRKVTFVDTPGHAAFTEMRARGANVTDIAVLVIAGDDGIMPQTEEAISHAQAAGVPIVVALNKIDLEGVDVTRILTQMTEHNLTPSEWGGDVEVVQTSAATGQGMEELLETLLTVAELNDYRANPNRDGLGVCLEARQDGERGVSAKIVVENGTLNVGDVIVCGPSYGRVRAMIDPLTGRKIKSAGPSCPVDILGLDQPPGAGDRFHVLEDIGQAREIAASREEGSRNQSLAGSTTKVSFERFQELLQDGQLGKSADVSRLNLIIRGDTRGSVEAIEKELTKFDHPEVEIRILQRSVGGVSLADVTLADASDAVILAFNVVPDDAARSLADERNIEIRRYSIIYKLADEIKLMIEGRLRPEERVIELGRALVKQVFQISRVGTIAGCYVMQGSIQRGCRIRVTRDGRVIGDYGLDTLRRIKEDVKEVARGLECGIKLSGFNDIKQDDVLEAYRIEQVARKLDM